MSTRSIQQRVLEFLFGSVVFAGWVLRSSAKLALAAMIAYVAHEGAARWRVQLTAEETTALRNFQSLIQTQLAGVPIGDRRVLFAFVADGIGIGCRLRRGADDPGTVNQSAPGSTSPGRHLTYAIWTAPRAAPTAGGQEAEPECPRPHADGNVGMRQIYRDDGSLVLRPISTPQLEASIDMMLRDIERVAFQPPAAAGAAGRSNNVAELRLCSGTRELLRGPACALTETIRLCLDGNACPARIGLQSVSIETTLASIISRRQTAALLIGEIQFLTLVAFFYSIIECIGLWALYVRPKARLFLLKDENINPIDEKNLQTEIDIYQKNNIRPIGDYIFISSLAKNEAMADIHRNFLQSDAESRIAGVERISDIMLKLAFAGTIIGIGAALFSARGLDTANPIEKLAIKSAMFAGIGVAFGTTLVGIVLSLISGIFTDRIGRIWEEKINRNYQRVLDYMKTSESTQFQKKIQPMIENLSHGRASGTTSWPIRIVTTFILTIIAALIIYITALWKIFQDILVQILALFT